MLMICCRDHENYGQFSEIMTGECRIINSLKSGLMSNYQQFKVRVNVELSVQFKVSKDIILSEFRLQVLTENSFEMKLIK